MSLVLLGHLPLLLISAPASLLAQVTIMDPPTCADCEIQIEAVGVLGDTTGPGFVSGIGAVLAADDGRLFVSSPGQEGTLLVFGPGGSYQGSLGRPGEGPGEFVSPRPVHVASDELFVTDDARGRLTKMAENGADTWPLPFIPRGALGVGPGTYVFAALPRTPDLVGLPLHVFSEEEGRVVASFGNPSGRYDPRDPLSLVLTLGEAAGPGVFWTAPTNEYRLTKWDVQGNIRRTMRRIAPWFEPWTGFAGSAWEVEPPPTIVGLRESADGLLWVFIQVPDDQWEPMEPRRLADGHTHTTEMMKHDLHDTLIEVIDPSSATLLHRQRFPFNTMAVVAPDLVVTYDEIGVGHPIYRVWRWAMNAPGGLEQEPTPKEERR